MRWALLAAVTLLLSLPCSALGEPSGEQQMAARIDALLAQRWAEEGVEPAGPASDAEFLRRAWLDLCGIIPPINDTDEICGIRGFLGDPGADKRERLVEALLAKPTHAAHFANVWRNVMLPPDVDVRRLGGDTAFQAWLRGKFADNVPYNQMVAELLLASGAANQNGPVLFYTALQLKPEELAASTSRIFLGTQIQCAQCHDHPFDHWTREDFWGYAAFFAQLQRPASAQQAASQVADTGTGELPIPDSDEVAKPRFLDGSASDDASGSRRSRLASWMTAADNPYFARATVNRVWAQLFGRGIVHPVDDLGQHNPPSHAQLLDELSQYFVETGFDLHRLIRTLAQTRAYQLSSRSESRRSQPAPELFAQMAIKSLTAEQLYDCLAEGMRSRNSSQTQALGRIVDQNRRAFLAKFRAPTQGATEYEAGIPQALTLMNGASIRQATDLSSSDLLVALNAPFFTNRERVDVLFMSTLSRPPSERERKEFESYVEQGGATGDSREALSDVLWALLNSAEFVLNH